LNRHGVPVEQDVQPEKFHVARWAGAAVLIPTAVRNRVEISRYEVIDVDRLRSHVAPFESNAPIPIIHRRGRQALTLVIAKRIDRTRVGIVARLEIIDRVCITSILQIIAYPVRTRTVQGAAIDLTLADANAGVARGALRAVKARYPRVE
jgi:hypothetical protein